MAKKWTEGGHCVSRVHCHNCPYVLAFDAALARRDDVVPFTRERIETDWGYTPPPDAQCPFGVEFAPALVAYHRREREVMRGRRKAILSYLIGLAPFSGIKTALVAHAAANEAEDWMLIEIAKEIGEAHLGFASDVAAALLKTQGNDRAWHALNALVEEQICTAREAETIATERKIAEPAVDVLRPD